jgi:hypothetical protein
MRKNSFKVTSISYVHDPEGAKKWFDIYTDLLLDQLKMDKKSEESTYNEP